MFTKPNLTSGIPIYVQVKEQIIHAVEIGAIKPGDQLPSVRVLAEQLVINPNTVIKIYKELETEGVVEIHHGTGAFVTGKRASISKAEIITKGAQSIQKIIEQLFSKGLSTAEIRRIMEAELLKKETNYLKEAAWKK